MKTKLTLFVLGSSLLMGASSLFAQITNTNTNSLPPVQSVKPQMASEQNRDLGVCALLSPRLKDKLHLTNAQRSELKPIEDDFAKTALEYKAANQPRIDAALEANRQARAAKSEAKIQAARKQLENVWAGLQKYRDASVQKVKPLLTPDQVTILEDPGNQWRENHGFESDDSSAN
jgi:Spy/CpxP family protein refolding chaperone